MPRQSKVQGGKRRRRSSNSRERDEDYKDPKTHEAYHRWSYEEKKRHLEFMKDNIDLFSLGENQRKRDKLFIKMAEFLGTKDNKQCRTHHGKVAIKYGGKHKQILLIIEGLSKQLCQDQSQQNKKSVAIKENKAFQTEKVVNNFGTMSEIFNSFRDKEEKKMKVQEVEKPFFHRFFNHEQILELIRPQKYEDQNEEDDDEENEENEENEKRPVELPDRSLEDLVQTYSDFKHPFSDISLRSYRTIIVSESQSFISGLMKE